jgi:hypothetical protein
MKLATPFSGPQPAAPPVGVLAASLILVASCDAPDPVTLDADLGLLPVVEITTTSYNDRYPERPPYDALNVPVCQIEVDVWFVLPDACSGFGDFTDLGLTGKTWRFEVHGYRSPSTGYCGSRITQPLGFCLPGLGLDPPPPALSSGHYVMIVNGFEGGFDIP